MMTAHGFLGEPSLTVLPPGVVGCIITSPKGTTVTQPHPDPKAVPPEGFQPPAAPSFPGQQYPAGPQGQQPYQAQPQGYAGPAQPYAGQSQYQGYSAAPQQPGYSAAPQQHGYSAAPQQPYAGQPQSQGYPQAPQQHVQYPAQPPMPNPAYGYPQPKSKLVAGLLGIFLGGLGIHRFYLGFTKIAVIQLVLTIVLGAFTFGLVALWGVVEGIMIIAGAAHFRVDAQGVPLRD
ncbi:NINE protein [Arthrobacter sp. 2YAF22_2]|uniref:NINE protein n=1 Tax=Arthrobacter sp. 2YAF22_2 TaxID=3233029 RepID=UPI003F90DA81